MRTVLVVGASGLLGGEVVRALDGRADVIPASRTGSQQAVDITDPASIEALFGRVGSVDAIVCTAGMPRFVPWEHATDDDWAHGLAQKLMGQVRLVRIGAPFVRDGGSITLTSGLLSRHPAPGGSIVTTVNSAVEGFVRSAAVEIGRGVRVNAVSPGWVTESLLARGMDPAPGRRCRPVLHPAGRVGCHGQHRRGREARPRDPARPPRRPDGGVPRMKTRTACRCWSRSSSEMVLHSDLATTVASSSSGWNTGIVAFVKPVASRVTMALQPAECAASCTTASS